MHLVEQKGQKYKARNQNTGTNYLLNNGKCRPPNYIKKQQTLFNHRKGKKDHY